jgi:predicted N-acyltransferase
VITPARPGHPVDAAPGEAALGGLHADAWDELVGPHFYSSAAWLRFCARHDGGAPGAQVCVSAGRPSATVPVLSVTEPPSPLYRWNDLLAAQGLPTLPERGLLVGPRQGYQTHLLVAPGKDRTAEVARLVQALRDWPLTDPADSTGTGCVAMYVTTPDAKALREAGVAAEPVLLEADAWFELPPGGWDAWLDALPSKRRGNVRREVRRFRDAGYTVEHRPLSECYEELPRLAASTQSKYGHAASPAYWLTLLRGHVEGMGCAARVSVCRRRDGAAVGFCLYYVWGDTLFLRWAGFDYEQLERAAEYFNLVYYSQIMRAPKLGVRRLHAGIKAPQAKALRGAMLRPLWLVDLQPDSALARHGDAIREHNRRAHERLVADLPPACAVDDAHSWLAFS